MQLNLSDEQTTALISATLVNAMGPEQRDALMTNAIKSLLTPPVTSGHYGSKPKSLLMEAFERAAQGVAHKIATEQLEENEAFKAQVRELFDEAWLKATTEKRDVLVDKLSSAIAKAISGDSY